MLFYLTGVEVIQILKRGYFMQALTTGFNPEYSEDASSLDEITALNGIAILEFGTPCCGHCLASREAVAQVMASHPDLVHIKVFDGKGKRLGRQFGVKLWPTLIALRDGVEVDRIVRFTSADEVRKLMDKVL